MHVARHPLLFYGWVVVGSGFVLNTLNAALVFHAFGAYVVLLEDDFGWSRTAFALAFALQRVESGLLGPVEGWLIDHFGPRKVMQVGIVIFGAGFMYLSQIDSLLTFYLAFLAIAMGSALGSFLPSTVAVVNWFNRRRAAALALVSMGFAAGGLVQPIVVAGLEEFGWRDMAFGSGVFSIAVGLPLTMLIRHRPEEHGWLPDGAAEVDPEVASGAKSGLTARQALRTRAFWFISLGHSASLLVIGAVSVHLSAHITETLDYSLGFAATVVTVMTVMMVIGQLGIGGLIGDRVNKKLVIIIAMLAQAASLALLAFATSAWMVFGFAALNGLGIGARGPLIQALRADYFGRTSFGTIMGFSSLVMTLGMVTGPVIAGLSYDITGSYKIGFVGLSVVAALGSSLFIFATAPGPMKPEQSESTAEAAG